MYMVGTVSTISLALFMLWPPPFLHCIYVAELGTWLLTASSWSSTVVALAVKSAPLLVQNEEHMCEMCPFSQGLFPPPPPCLPR